MPRLFTGIELPEPIRDQLADLRVPLPGAKWVDPDDLHLTLRFIGDVDNRVAAEFRDALSLIQEPGFAIRISGLGAFGGNQPKAIWAGIEASRELDALARANERAARNAGLAPERHGFKAHITLARLKYTRSDEVARVLGTFGGIRLEPFMVDRFVLFSSRPQVGGGPYVVEEEFPLGGFGEDAYQDGLDW